METERRIFATFGLSHVERIPAGEAERQHAGVELSSFVSIQLAERRSRDAKPLVARRGGRHAAKAAFIDLVRQARRRPGARRRHVATYRSRCTSHGTNHAEYLEALERRPRW